MDQQPRQIRGRQNYLAGQSGEASVARHYQALGYQVVAQRWRGMGCELDLVLEGDTGLIFVEVKTARSHDLAAQRLTQTQIQRIFAAATIFVDRHTGGDLVNMRFDVALVDRTGQVQILENALMAA